MVCASKSEWRFYISISPAAPLSSESPAAPGSSSAAGPSVVVPTSAPVGGKSPGPY